MSKLSLKKPKKWEDLDSALQEKRNEGIMTSVAIEDTSRLLDDPNEKKIRSFMKSSGLDRKLNLYESITNDKLLRERAEEGSEGPVHKMSEIKDLCVQLGMKFLPFKHFNCPLSLEEEVSMELTEFGEKVGIDFNSYTNSYDMDKFFVMASPKYFKKDSKKYDLETVKKQLLEGEEEINEDKEGFAVFYAVSEDQMYSKPYQFGRLYTARNTYLSWMNRDLKSYCISRAAIGFFASMLPITLLAGAGWALPLAIATALAVPAIGIVNRYKGLPDSVKREGNAVQSMFNKEGWNKL
jgi:hypothetical protein